MSHANLFIVVPQNIFSKGEKSVEIFIEDRMQYYDENMSVPKYQKKCWCVGMIAEREADKQLENEMGSWVKVRNDFHKRHKVKKDNERDKLYEKEVYKPRVKRLKEIIDKHPLKGNPDKKCSDCKGTGIMDTTYNPNSKWDWYRVGGRWDGFIVDNEQSSENGFNFNKNHETLENNSCQIKNLKNKVPFAFIDSKREWHEIGQMGWWGAVSNKKDNWDKEFVKLLKKEKQTDFLVSLDFHI